MERQRSSGEWKQALPKCIPILISSEIQFTLSKAANLLSYRFSGFCINIEKYKQVGSSGNTSDLIWEVYMYSLSCDTTYPDFPQSLQTSDGIIS